MTVTPEMVAMVCSNEERVVAKSALEMVALRLELVPVPVVTMVAV